MIVTSNKDPYYILMSNGLSVEPSSNQLKIGTIFMFVLGIALMAIPFCYIVNVPDVDEIKYTKTETRRLNRI